MAGWRVSPAALLLSKVVPLRTVAGWCVSPAALLLSKVVTLRTVAGWRVSPAALLLSGFGLDSCNRDDHATTPGTRPHPSHLDSHSHPSDPPRALAVRHPIFIPWDSDVSLRVPGPAWSAGESCTGTLRGFRKRSSGRYGEHARWCCSCRYGEHARWCCPKELTLLRVTLPLRWTEARAGSWGCTCKPPFYFIFHA